MIIGNNNVFEVGCRILSILFSLLKFFNTSLAFCSAISCVVVFILSVILCLVYFDFYCDAMQSAVIATCLVRLCLCLSVCPSIRPSVTFRYVFQTGSNTSKIIPWLNSLRYLIRLTHTWAIWSKGNTPRYRVE